MKEIIVAYDENTERSPVIGEWVGELIMCKDCKHQHEYRTGSCPYYTTYGSVPPDGWYCADGKKNDVSR